jgi:hypothetical protein
MVVEDLVETPSGKRDISCMAYATRLRQSLMNSVSLTGRCLRGPRKIRITATAIPRNAKVHNHIPWTFTWLRRDGQSLVARGLLLNPLLVFSRSWWRRKRKEEAERGVFL